MIEQATVASDRDASIGATLQGGASAQDGKVNTQGRGTDNKTVSAVSAAQIGVANGVDTTASGVGANAGTIAGVNGAQQTIVANGATAYGAQSLAQDENTTAIGFRATATYSGSVAIGYQSRAIADPAVAIGANSLAQGNNSVALGAGSQSLASNSVAIGSGAQASGENSVALGNGSRADQANTVSVGSEGHERRLTNVAPGINPTDGVNVAQLTQVQENLNQVANQAFSGIAMSMAMSGTYLPTMAPGDKAFGVGVGGYRGYGALAVNFKQLAQDGKMSWGVGLSTTGKDWGFNAGIGWKWQ